MKGKIEDHKGIERKQMSCSAEQLFSLTKNREQLANVIANVGGPEDK